MKVTVNVIDVLNGEKLSFPLSSDTNFSIRNLKDEVESFCPRQGDYRLLFIRNGIVLGDEDEVIPGNLSHDNPYIDFYMVTQPRVKEPSDCTKLIYKIDETSLLAAKTWVESTKAEVSSNFWAASPDPLLIKQQNIISKYVDALSQLNGKEGSADNHTGAAASATATGNNAAREIPGAGAGEAGAEGGVPIPVGADAGIAGAAGAVAGAVAGAGNGYPPVRWVDWRILSRLVMGFVLFAQGASFTRAAIFITGGLIYYVIETGILYFCMRLLFPSLFPVRPPQPIPQPLQAAIPPPGAAGAGAAAAAAAPADANAMGENPPLLNVQQPPPPVGIQQQQQQPPNPLPLAPANVDGVIGGVGVGAAAPGAVDAAAAAPAITAAGGASGAAAAVAIENRTLLQVVADYSYDGAPVPRTAGLLKDAFSLSSSLFLSLVPEWNPYGRQPFNG